ncbi:MAG: T9SS type A sorting domain-containing protein [Candidatus Cloacimonetes bacterium]|nr:T9SS type A sorting domain-containing protein [Candidatus Cloacimonadota bacterium]
MNKTMIFVIALMLVSVCAFAANRGEATFTISPNPVDEVTTITVFLPANTTISLTVEDNRGTILHTLYTGALSAGVHNFEWDGTTEDGERLAPGPYTVDLQDERFTSVKRIIILK